MNHVFVDFENVHGMDPALIGDKATSFTLLLGPRQTKLDVSLVETMLQHAASVELIRLTSSGRNALDFALSYYLGQKVLADPTGCFHLVSKDKGYDPLVDHLRSRHIDVRRHDDFKTLTFCSKAGGAADSARNEVEKVLERLRKNVAGRPKKRATLLSHLRSNLGKNATEADALRVFEDLRKAGHLSLGDKDSIAYRL